MSDARKEEMIKAIKDAVMVEIKGQQLYHHAAEKARAQGAARVTPIKTAEQASAKAGAWTQ